MVRVRVLDSVSKCRKSFTFAEVRETDISLKKLAEIDCEGYYGNSNFSEEEIDNWVAQMEYHLEPLKVGDTVVYLDGHYIPIQTENVEIEGIYADHDIEKLPHVIAENADELRSILSDSTYWLERAVEDYEWLDNNNPYELYQEAISEIKFALEKSAAIPFDNQFFYRMIYMQIFSTTEAFLSDRLKQLILLNDNALEFFCKNDEKIKSLKYKAETVFKGKPALRQSVMGAIQERIFHRFQDVVRDFQSACDTTIEIDSELTELVKFNSKRHDCVHRNGRNADGNLRSISMEELQNLLDNSEAFCSKIENCVAKFIVSYSNSEF